MSFAAEKSAAADAKALEHMEHMGRFEWLEEPARRYALALLDSAGDSLEHQWARAALARSTWPAGVDVTAACEARCAVFNWARLTDSANH